VATGKISEGSAEFAPLERVLTKTDVSLAGGQAQFMDLAGDGLPGIVVMDGPGPGFYEHDEAEGWQAFRTFASRLNRDMRDPNLKFVDLDGHADALITGDMTKKGNLPKDATLGGLLYGRLTAGLPGKPDDGLRLFFDAKDFSDMWIAVTWSSWSLATPKRRTG
jgi:hypothetical protein